MTVDSISISSGKKQVVLALGVENLTSETKHLALKSKKYGRNYEPCSVSLIDDRGSYLLHRKEGIEGISCLYKFGAENEDWLTEFAPKSRTAIVILFTSKEEIEGEVFAFSAEVYKVSGGKMTNFSVGISNIQLR